MDSFAAPLGQRASGRRHAAGGADWRTVRMVRMAAACAAVFAASVSVAPVARAQESGVIMIPGPGETNPSAVVAMAKNAGMNVDGNNNSVPKPVNNGAAAISQIAGTARQGGFAASAAAADAAMRAAALALDARADAADDSASANAGDSSGMIVIPGPGEAKAATAAPKLAMTPARSVGAVNAANPPNASGMIEIPGNGEPKPVAAINTVNTVHASRDVVPVVLSTEGVASQIPMQARGFQARPIAAATPLPVAGIMPVSMRTSAPMRPAFSGAAPAAAAPAAPQASQDGELIRTTALAFLTQQAAGLPGKPEITVSPVFPRGLAACDTLEPFMPSGARLWGRTTVGVRCSGARPWTMYLQARVAVHATYYTAARAMAPGEMLSAADLIPREGDLTMMPQAIVTDPTQAVGAVTLQRLAAGLPLRTDMLKGAGAISIGQSVRVVTGGDGFSISAEGSAMNNATPGQQVRVKTAGGQIISGIAKDSSTVEIRL